MPKSKRRRPNFVNHKESINDNSDASDNNNGTAKTAAVTNISLNNEKTKDKECDRPLDNKRARTKKKNKSNEVIVDIDIDNDNEDEVSGNNTLMNPKIICGCNLSAEIFDEMKAKAESLGIQLTRKWGYGRTDMMLFSHDSSLIKLPSHHKVHASIISVLDDSHAKGCIVDYKNYLCNYRQIPKEYGKKFFGNYEVRFDQISTQTLRLKLLLTLGGATIIESEQANKETSNSQNVKQVKILLCDRSSTTNEDAKQLSHKHKCRIISYNWVIDSIYKVRNDIIDERKQPPVIEPLNLDDFDLSSSSE
ncbi:hypothetical protein RFI_12800 [Reticulomyxa filosa]|uniref:BRCT domain-containing protein n=1 Tax=Reticulomyxa filosa TaxID=46433 RepID=X6NEG9_RETFI|nr:hypothetical protein RFI_12800 [Reticulomyxa filosa]|eukprot:ETO24356.1 hypothetical protein RFI_12800 [Reticulomyxa filosa]